MNRPCDILVIDDEAVVLQGVARICQSEGLTVDAASSGRGGLDRLSRGAYRLILCDLMMGDLDGFEFLAEARRQRNRTPVIMTTGNCTVQNAVRSLHLGAVDCLSKPFTAEELMAVVSRGLRYQALLPRGGEGGPDPGRCPPHLRRLGYLSWAQVESVGTVLMGLHAVFVRTLQGIRSLVLATEGTELVQGAGCVSIVSADGLGHEVMAPVSGRILEANAAVTAEPSTLERDPYTAGWLYRVLPSDLQSSLESLSCCSNLSDPHHSHPQGEPP